MRKPQGCHSPRDTCACTRQRARACAVRAGPAPSHAHAIHYTGAWIDRRSLHVLVSVSAHGAGLFVVDGQLAAARDHPARGRAHGAPARGVHSGLCGRTKRRRAAGARWPAAWSTTRCIRTCQPLLCCTTSACSIAAPWKTICAVTRTGFRPRICAAHSCRNWHADRTGARSPRCTSRALATPLRVTPCRRA